jgi:hypothetical protein
MNYGKVTMFRGIEYAFREVFLVAEFGEKVLHIFGHNPSLRNLFLRLIFRILTMDQDQNSNPNQE